MYRYLKSRRQRWAGLLILTLLVLTRRSLAMPAGLGARQADNTASTNTSTPIISAADSTQDEFEPGWVSGPTTRGTLNIIFTCVITLSLCVWTTVQVNIEPPQDNVNKTLFKLIPALENEWLGKLLAHSVARKIGWSCVTIIVPEAVLAIAAYERRAAYLLHKAIKDSKNKDWDLTICYYAVMGGFVIAKSSVPTSNPGAEPVDASEPTSSPDHDKTTNVPVDPKGTTKSKEKEHEALTKRSRVDDAIARVRNGENHHRTLTPQGVYLVYKRGKLPDITPEEVKDKNKAIAYMPTHTTFCALAMYATWWFKPVDVNLPTSIELEDPALLDELSGDYSDSGENAEETRNIKETTSPLGRHSARIRYLTSRAGLGKLMYIDLFGDDLFNTKSYFQTLGNAYGRLWSGRKLLRREAAAISFVGLVYGGVHLAAWRNRFPTEAEQMLWRVAAVITAVGWSGFVLSLGLGIHPLLRKICGVLFGICAIPCLFVRVYLLVESFISLRMLPKKSYDINVWSELWPHAG